MKNCILLLLLLSFCGSIFAQYNYGLEVEKHDALIDGKLNINSEGDNIFIGNEAGLNMVPDVPNFTGIDNIFLGPGAGKNNISGHTNIFIGNFAGRLSSSNSNNIFLGTQSGQHNTGFQNVFIGHFTGGLNRGIRNTFLGQRAGGNNQSGSLNTFVGFFAGSQSSGSSNVFIGNEAGRNAQQSNRLYIENSASDQPLIYGEFDNDVVQINGSLNVSDVLSLIPQAPPSGACNNKGDMVYGTDDELYVCKGITWKKILTN